MKNNKNDILYNAMENQEDFLSKFLIENYKELDTNNETNNTSHNFNNNINNNNTNPNNINNNDINNNGQQNNIISNTVNNFSNNDEFKRILTHNTDSLIHKTIKQKALKTSNHNNKPNNYNINYSSNYNSNVNKSYEKTFYRLKELQQLYKKESALKELFTQTSNKIKTNITQYSKDIYKKKLDVNNILNKINSKNYDQDKKKCILYEDKTFLGNLNNYVPKFLNYLWENPDFVAKILMNAEIQDIKEYLAPFISNNFYENILSPNYIEDYLMYILCILLKDEINKMQSHNDFSKFLCSTVCGTMMGHLSQRSDIQEYFKFILEDVFEQIEMTCSNKKMTFILKEIEEQLIDQNKGKKSENKNNIKNKNKSQKKSVKSKTNQIEKCSNIEEILACETFSATSFNMSLSFLNFESDEIEVNYNKINDNSKEEEFSKAYDKPMNRELIEELITENQYDKNLNEYLVLQLRKMGEDKDIYSNKNFKEKAAHSELFCKILESYQSDFIKTISFIDKILDNLLNNFQFLPYSIKCLCKIISIFIKKKFPNITTVEENAFISQFFFYNLFVPIFNSPTTGALINNFIISGNTIHNLNIISYIILQFASGNFFKNNLKNGDFTFYNRFFVDKMPKLFTFFDKMTKVELPSFIEKYVNDELPIDYTYDYFKENPDKLMFQRTICYSLYDLTVLLDNIENCKKKLFNEKTTIFEKTFEKLNSKATRNLISTLKKNQKKEIIKKIIPGKGKKPPELKEVEGKKYMYYFLENELLCNERYSQLFSIEQKAPYFRLKELKKESNENEIIKNNIIKVKNFFSALLTNYIDLVKNDFNEYSILSVKDILKELKLFLKSSNFVVDGKIPMEWYATTLIEYLDKIPQELTKNNCELLFNEIEKDLNNSLQELDFEALSVCLGYMKFSQKGISYYEKAKECLIDIELNNIVKKITEEETIPVNIEFKYTNKSKEFKIYKKVKEKQIFMLDNMIFENNKKKPIFCDTIQMFTKKFPNLSKYKILQDLDPFIIQGELKVPEKLDNYFNIIQEHLIENKKIFENEDIIISDEKTLHIINDKIYDYVMTKIYNKIYTPETDKIDNIIFSQCIKLSWTEPKNFIKDKKNYVYDSFLPDVIQFFKKIDIEKSPRKKLINMSNIFQSISNLVNFNNGEGKTEIGVDDQMPILNYSFIKAQPERIYSNCRYMELYIGDKKSKEEGNQLTQLMGLCMYVKDLTYKSLFDVTEKEFNIYCTKAAENQI